MRWLYLDPFSYHTFVSFLKRGVVSHLSPLCRRMDSYTPVNLVMKSTVNTAVFPVKKIMNYKAVAELCATMMMLQTRRIGPGMNSRYASERVSNDMFCPEIVIIDSDCHII